MNNLYRKGLPIEYSETEICSTMLTSVGSRGYSFQFPLVVEYEILEVH